MAIRKDTLTLFGDKKGVPPLKCTCGVLNLVIKTDGLVRHPGKVIEVNITAISAWDTPVIDPSNTTKLRYQFDYTIEYDDALLVNTQRGIRGCDIEISCCETCTSAFIKGELKKTVRTITGPLVNNTDPANPIILDETLTTLTSELVGGEENNYRVYSYRNEDGAVVTFVGGTSSIIAPNVNKGVGPGQSIEAISVQGTQIRLDTATMPSYVADGAVASMPGGPGIDITAVGFYDLFDFTLALTNPNPRYTLKGMLFAEASAFIAPLKDSARIKLLTSLTKVGDPLNEVMVDEIHSTSTMPGGPMACVLKKTFAMNLNEIINVNIPPLASATLRFKGRIQNTTGGTASSLLNHAFGGLRFQGMAAA